MQTEQFWTAEDECLAEWLSLISEPQKVHGRISGQTLSLTFDDVCAARSTWERAPALKQGAGLDLRVEVPGRFTKSTKVQQMTSLSRWAAAHPAVMQMDRSICTVMVHSADPDTGFRFLSVQPYRGIERILNKPSKDLINQPLETVASEIAEAKRWLIQEAIRRGRSEIVTHTYTHNWIGGVWAHKLVGRFEPDYNEVIIKTDFGSGWQRDFWDHQLHQLQPES